MPRLSLYKPEKGNDYKFIDRQASEMFQVGGTDVYLHKYLGAAGGIANTPDQPIHPTINVANIQDLLFLENRDRNYDREIYRIRGIYNVQNIDFNLSQFGLFIDNDTLYMTVHINDFIKYIGRKPISGDVLELPHLRDDFALNDFDISLPRYYVIEDVGRASEGFSVTWFPHLYRLKLKRITDAQQFSQIFNQTVTDSNGDPDPNGTTLKDLLSTYNQEIDINNQVLAQAEADAPKSGYETRQFYTLAATESGRSTLQLADSHAINASNAGQLASGVYDVPLRTGYTGYLVSDGVPVNGLQTVNGYAFGFGVQFPAQPEDNDFFLRTDFFPNRLFRFDVAQHGWIAVEDSVRMNLTNTPDSGLPVGPENSRQTQKTGFINNNTYTYTSALGSDYIKYSQVQIDQGVTSIATSLDYASLHLAPYVVIKFEVTKLEFALAEYPSLYTNVSGKLKINLPVISSVQQKIPYAGQWIVTLYNAREEQRQPLSKVLRRPEVDF
jgi:hypothetical protein